MKLSQILNPTTFRKHSQLTKGGKHAVFLRSIAKRPSYQPHESQATMVDEWPENMHVMISVSDGERPQYSYIESPHNNNRTEQSYEFTLFIDSTKYGVRTLITSLWYPSIAELTQDTFAFYTPEGMKQVIWKG